jgi:hypothetical protein
MYRNEKISRPSCQISLHRSPRSPTGIGGALIRPPLHCSKCKKLGHIRKNCSDYQCGGCLWWGPGHTTPNCETKKEADRVWENETKKYRECRPWGYDVKTGEQRWKATHKWAGVTTILNEEWDSPKKQPEVIDLTSPSPPPSLLLPTPPPSLWTPPSSPPYRPWSPSQLTPLFDLTDLVSDFDSVASSNSSISDLGNVGDIEV